MSRVMATDRSRAVSTAGFTLVELLLVISITAILASVVLGFMLDYWGSAATMSNDSQIFVERQNAGDRLRTALNVAAGLIDQNSIADTNTLVPDPSDVSGTHWLLIHAVPENIPVPGAGSYTPVFYFQAPSVNAAKQFIMNGSQSYYDEYVLYLNGSTKQLLLRTLANPNAVGNAAKTSCPPGQATTSCPADLGIASDLSSVDVNYYSKSGNVINYTSLTDPTTGDYIGPDFPVVEVVQLTLHFARNATIKGSTPSMDQTVVRVALRN